MKKIKNLLKYDKKIMSILNIIAIIGIITGSIFIIILNKHDKQSLVQSLNNYFKITKITNISLNCLKNIFINNSFVLIIIWIMGLSIIGLFIILFIIFYKAFILGFTVSSLIYTYSYKGILLSIVYVFPHMIINLLLYLYIASYSLKLSIILFNAIIKKENLNFKLFLRGYIKVLSICFFIIIITSIYEGTILPVVINFVKQLL